ncbi:hypothetical protein GWO43_12130 [candidate division KSB1 bacterium]|nr:hypothetical protein [candidate division KSB1 bacterium]NIR70966.1 hypothetical protein [candidate division KSB1 bacterium]NIS24702.1 hypothetical protein [candidate division KSB1 bacterium]NIT71611.1 hypothetical protein [candidate division KSB1 bacterium]NIU25315.1 hypothetical protein [candidate division KSB1 bacterium]
MKRLKSKTSDFVALCCGVVFALVLGEILLRIYFGKNERFYVHKPNISVEFTVPDSLIPDIAGSVRFSTNAQGMRGQDYPRDHRTYRILAVGGSTTMCSFLDDAKTWPALVQKNLNVTADGRDVWVGNIGKDGVSTRSHMQQMMNFVPQFELDAILLLIGINDLSLKLVQQENYDPDFLSDPKNRRKQVLRTFAIVPDSFHPLYKHFGFWKLARRTKSYLKHHTTFEENAETLLRWRNYRKVGKEIDVMPDLTAALQEYASNLSQIIELAEQLEVRIIFMTQPVLWHDNMNAEETAALIAGFYGNPGELEEPLYYSPEILQAGIDMFNDKLKQVCREQSSECIDLAGMIPQNLQVFYDDCHYTEYGAELVAETVAAYLKNAPPFSEELSVR